MMMMTLPTGITCTLDRRVQLRSVTSAPLSVSVNVSTRLNASASAKTRNRRALRLEAEPGAPLPRRRDSYVTDRFPHHCFMQRVIER
jgi:hypothetical protein